MQGDAQRVPLLRKPIRLPVLLSDGRKESAVDCGSIRRYQRGCGWADSLHKDHPDQSADSVGDGHGSHAVYGRAPVQQENVQEEPENAQKSPENDQDEEKRVCISDKRKILDKLYVLRQKILNNNKADAAILAEEVVSMIGDWDVEEHNPN